MNFDQLNELNEKTNNSLFEIMFNTNKYHLNINKYNRIQSYPYNQAMTIVLDGQHYSWNPSVFLKNVIKFD